MTVDGDVEQWEYAFNVVSNQDVEQTLRHVLNWRGSQGWELVSLSPRVKPVIGGLQGGDMIAVFKRRGLGSFNHDLAEPPAY